MRNSIFGYVAEQYGTQPEYLWEKTPDAAVIRRRDNKKWYGIIMNVRRSAVGLSGEGRLDVLNVKCSPAVREVLLAEKRAFPAYHMNKLHWISLPLDGSLEERTIFNLIDESYLLTK